MIDKGKNKIYEEEEELIDHEDGNLTEIKRESYQGHPMAEKIFEQFIVMEKEKNQLLKSSALDKCPGISIVRQYMEIKSYKKLKALLKKLLGK